MEIQANTDVTKIIPSQEAGQKGLVAQEANYAKQNGVNRHAATPERLFVDTHLARKTQGRYNARAFTRIG
jgi:hypothetical protein